MSRWCTGIISKQSKVARTRSANSFLAQRSTRDRFGAFIAMSYHMSWLAFGGKTDEAQL
jgi:hypothetical protein